MSPAAVSLGVMVIGKRLVIHFSLTFSSARIYHHIMTTEVRITAFLGFQESAELSTSFAMWCEENGRKQGKSAGSVVENGGTLNRDACKP